MKYFIITGTSRGLGEAIAKQLHAPDHYLFCLSRERNDALLNGNRKHLAFDLNDVERIEELMEEIFNSIDRSNVDGIYLVNNAAVIAPVGFIGSVQVKEISMNITVNLLAPIILTSLFIRLTSEMNTDKRIINISSGSAQNLLPGMSVYSASKAGLDVFTQCVGLEQNTNASPVKIASIWPGMIDTSLQTEARMQDKVTFPAAELFEEAKNKGMLTTAEDTARQVVEYLLNDEFEHGAIADLYDYSKVQG